jgi:hypothetical protein
MACLSAYVSTISPTVQLSPDAFELSRIASTEPWSEKGKILALELLGK